MAIYHLTVKTITRTKGQSSVRSAAYRHAARMFDERAQKYENYSDKKNVIHCEIIAPLDPPQWLKDILLLREDNFLLASEALWNKVELSEKMQTSQLAREVEFALPIELEKEKAIFLAREFITDQFVLSGMIADWSVHWDENNPHVHVMLTMREITAQGFGKKCRNWNNKLILNEWRKNWAEYANFHLKLNQHDVRIDHRSYQDQGINLIPTTHQGKAVNDMESRGIPTDIIIDANHIKQENLQRIAKNPECLLNKVTSQKEGFSYQDIVANMSCYVSDKAHCSALSQETKITTTGILANESLHKINNGDVTFERKPTLTSEIIKKILNDIEYHDSVFSEREIAKALSPYTDNAEAFAKALIEVKTSRDLISLGLGEDGRDRYTTKKMFEIENNLQILSERMHKKNHVRITGKKVEQILRAYEKANGFVLTAEQIHAVKHITRKTNLSCMVGRAGTGKSFTLGAARAVWQAQGLNVYGIALSGVAAAGLKESSGIDASTIESFRYCVKENLIHLNKDDVVVMDEAGMTDSQAMLAVLEAVYEAKAKLVLVGNPQQLQPVGPGASFRAILESTGFCEIQTIYRQKEEWQRKATLELAGGNINEALALYDAKGYIHFEKTALDAQLKIVSDWLKLNKELSVPINEILLITHSNADVATLNELIRKERLRIGDISNGELIKNANGYIRVSVNDRLLMKKNDSNLGIKNGNFATVIKVSKNELIVKIDGNDNKTVSIDPQHYNHFDYGYASPQHYDHLDYGYAATVHKVQGLTVDHSLVYSNGFGWNKNLTYVALSRHRKSCHIYSSNDVHVNKQAFFNAHNKQQLKDSILDYPLAFAERRGLQIRVSQRDNYYRTS